jgi:hypothetical protein
MTLSKRKIHFLCASLLFLSISGAQAAAQQDVAAAKAAVNRAAATNPVGEAAQSLQAAQQSLAESAQLLAKRKERDATRAAQRAEALADLASVQMRWVQARRDVDDKSARNANLRRELLVVPGGRP